MFRLKLIFCVSLLNAFALFNANDVCYAPFSEFLKCLIREGETKLQSYQQEITPAFQNRIKTCFRQANCVEPDFNRASVDYFLAEPWSSRVKTLLDLLESTDPRVQQCMLRYFESMAERKIQQCVRQYGSADVKNFEMPPLPDIQNIDIGKMKTVVLDRMMIFRSTLDCTRITTSDDTLQQTIDCVKAQRTTDSQSMCHARENCRQTSIRDSNCLNRFDNVHSAACECAKKEHSGGLDNWKELKESFIGGGLERQYKKCYADNNLPYPEEKVKAVKKAIQDSVRDILLSGGIPPEVKEALSTAGGALKDISNEWKGLFCSDCNESKTLSTGTDDAKKMRETLERHDSPSTKGNQGHNNFLEKLRNLFGQNNNN